MFRVMFISKVGYACVNQHAAVDGKVWNDPIPIYASKEEAEGDGWKCIKDEWLCPECNKEWVEI